MRGIGINMQLQAQVQKKYLHGEGEGMRKHQHCRIAVLKYHRRLRYRLKCANVYVGTEEELRTG